MFIGRTEELNELYRRYNTDHFEMGIIYGPRRIGKTSLLKESIKNVRSFYYQAKESNEYDNRKSFSLLVNNFLHIPYAIIYPTYSDAFDELIKFADDKPFVIIIDEISFIDKADKGFLSELQFCIDHKFKDTKVKLLLSGSNISFMKTILRDNSAPLFLRNTFQMHITELIFSEAAAFLAGIQNEDKIKYLSIFGGNPFYLEMIDKSKSFDENIKSLLFSKFGNLLDAPDKVLPSASQDQNNYNTILKAIANGRRSDKVIADFINKDDNFVAVYLSRLTENEIIEKRQAFNKNQKLNYYEISDNLIRFWYRFIFDCKEEIALGLGDNIYEDNKEEINDFIAHGFEDVAISYLTEQNIKGLLPCYYSPIRNYKVDNSKLGRSIELDGLAEGLGKNKNSLLVLECKYRNSCFSIAMLNQLKESISIFDKYTDNNIYLFSKSGFSQEIINLKDPTIHLLTTDDLFKDLHT